MLDHIEKLREKPEAVRRRVLYISVTIIMAIIIVVWLLTLPFRFDGGAGQNENEGPSPFRTLTEQAGVWYDDFWRGIDRIKELL